MTEATKQRLRDRFEEILNRANKKPRTINDIEQIALEVRDNIAQATLEEISNEAQQNSTEQTTEPTETLCENASKVRCPDCCSSAWSKGKRPRRLITLAGVLTLSRTYYYCRHCDHGFCPIDTCLNLPKGCLTTLLAQEVACLSACLPFEQAMQTLFRLTKVSVCPRTAQRLCLGAVQQQVKHFQKERKQMMLPLAFAPLSDLPPSLPRPDILYLAADGIQTPMDDGSWREMKVGVVRSEHKDGREDRASRYVTHLGTAKDFGEDWEALGIECGSLCAKCLVALGDGAAWLWNLVETRFPKAIQILDFWHALEYVGAVARDAFASGDAAKDAAKRAWLSARAAEMKRSAWQQVTAALESVRCIATESVDAALRYFGNNVSRIDYAHYLKQGLCIGSGLAESSCKRLVTQRLKGSGMHWGEAGAQVISSLRGLLLGGEWEDFISFWNRPHQNAIPSPSF